MGQVPAFGLRVSLKLRRIAGVGSPPAACKALMQVGDAGGVIRGPAVRVWGRMHVAELAVDHSRRQASAAARGGRMSVSASKDARSDGVMTSTDDLGRLIGEVAARADRAAFARLFEHFAPRVKGYLMKSGAAADLAEEIAQETLAAVWRKAASFDPARGGASTWVFTIARNLRIDALRRDRRGQLAADPFEREAEPEADALIEAEERDQRVREAMRGLSRDQVQVIRLSFFEDKPHSEIAAALGLPLGTVKSRLRLAMTRMRQALEDLR